MLVQAVTSPPVLRDIVATLDSRCQSCCQFVANALVGRARHSDPRPTLNVYSHLTLSDTAKAVESLPDVLNSPARHQPSAGTESQPINDSFSHLLPTAVDGNSRIESDTGVITHSDDLECTSVSPGKTEGFVASERPEAGTVVGRTEPTRRRTFPSHTRGGRSRNWRCWAGRRSAKSSSVPNGRRPEC
jgi:hypothetical protein